MSDPLDRIECVQGDLTAEPSDAIVNAASTALRGGGGVDGAIHRAAGPGLLAELVERYPEGCRTGEARITGGHELPARFVIHAVGPRWRGGGNGEAEQLASAYRDALRLAAEAGAKTVAFSAISCGIYGYPQEQAAEVSLAALATGLAEHEGIARARMVLFDAELLGVFTAAFEELRRRGFDRRS